MFPSSTATAVVTVRGLTLETPQRILVEEADFSLTAGRHTALVGRNGSGKTTLLATIASRFGGLPPAHARAVAGTVAVAAGATCTLVSQHPVERDYQQQARAYVDARAGAAADAWRRYAALIGDTGRIADEGGLRAYDELVGTMDALEAWDYDKRRDRMVRGLGMERDQLDRSLGSLSGGEATKLRLVAALLAAPDLLLLDEPTNNLDAAAVDFLSDWLRQSPAAALLVSHDRVFLDEVTDEVLEIDEHGATVALYGGNYTLYAARKRADFDAALRQYEEQVARREALLASAGVLSRSAQRFQSMSSSDFHRARGRKVARRATVQVARVERELGALAEPQAPRRPRIVVAPVPAGRGPVLAAKDLCVAVGSRELLRGLSITLQRGERVAVTGPNGSGKTTLLRVLLGELTPAAGRVDRDPTAHLAYLPQTVVPPAPGERVLERVRRLAPISEDEARRLLGEVVFTDVGDLPMAGLSAGERRRIELAVLFAGAPDAVVLDEPTNHLDLPTIEMLEEALNDYTGALLTVSHDSRYLENAGVERIITMGGG